MNALKRSSSLLKIVHSQIGSLVCKGLSTQAQSSISPAKIAAPSQAQFSILRASGAGGPVIRRPVYAIVEVGALQYKVSPGDLIYAERLRHVDVGTELSFSSVQAAGTRSQTLIGRPYVDGASVTAVIEVSPPLIIPWKPPTVKLKLIGARHCCQIRSLVISLDPHEDEENETFR